MSQPTRPRRRRVLGAVALGLVAAAAGVGVAVVAPWSDDAAAAAPVADPVTAAVVRTTLTSELRLAGELTFGELTPLPPAAGTITVPPTAGAVVGQGEQVYEADGAPVVLFSGARPFWRDLSVDSSDGVDVEQLERNLADLGFFHRTPDERFDWRTRQAVRGWQRSLGVEQTGELTASSVVVVDAPSIRIDKVTARAGEGDVSPATVSATTLHASATLTAAQARTLTAGTPVTLAFGDGRELDAALSAVDPGGQALADGTATPARAVVQIEDQSLLDGVGPSPVRITVRSDDDQAATLVVPVTALLATADGGYAVEAWDGVAAHVVPVEVGLVADARVQILGGDLAEGDVVVLAR